MCLKHDLHVQHKKYRANLVEKDKRNHEHIYMENTSIKNTAVQQMKFLSTVAQREIQLESLIARQKYLAYESTDYFTRMSAIRHRQVHQSSEHTTQLQFFLDELSDFDFTTIELAKGHTTHDLEIVKNVAMSNYDTFLDRVLNRPSYDPVQAQQDRALWTKISNGIRKYLHASIEHVEHSIYQIEYAAVQALRRKHSNTVIDLSKQFLYGYKNSLATRHEQLSKRKELEQALTDQKMHQVSLAYYKSYIESMNIAPVPSITLPVADRAIPVFYNRTSISALNAAHAVLQAIRYGLNVDGVTAEPLCPDIYDKKLMLWADDEQCQINDDGCLDVQGRKEIKDRIQAHAIGVAVVLSSNSFFGRTECIKIGRMLFYCIFDDINLVEELLSQPKLKIIHIRLEERCRDRKLFVDQIQEHCDVEYSSFPKWTKSIDKWEALLQRPRNTSYINLSKHQCKRCIVENAKFWCLNCKTATHDVKRLANEVVSAFHGLPAATTAYAVRTYTPRHYQILKQTEKQILVIEEELSLANARVAQTFESCVKESETRYFKDAMAHLEAQQQCKDMKDLAHSELDTCASQYFSQLDKLHPLLPPQNQVEILQMQIEDFSSYYLQEAVHLHNRKSYYEFRLNFDINMQPYIEQRQAYQLSRVLRAVEVSFSINT